MATGKRQCLAIVHHRLKESDFQRLFSHKQKTDIEIGLLTLEYTSWINITFVEGAKGWLFGVF